jgi:hypothetical protein
MQLREVTAGRGDQEGVRGGGQVPSIRIARRSQVNLAW